MNALVVAVAQQNTFDARTSAASLTAHRLGRQTRPKAGFNKPRWPLQEAAANLSTLLGHLLPVRPKTLGRRCRAELCAIPAESIYFAIHLAGCEWAAPSEPTCLPCRPQLKRPSGSSWQRQAGVQ